MDLVLTDGDHLLVPTFTHREEISERLAMMKQSMASLRISSIPFKLRLPEILLGPQMVQELTDGDLIPEA